MLAQSWATVLEGGPTLNQHWMHTGLYDGWFTLHNRQATRCHGHDCHGKF